MAKLKLCNKNVDVSEYITVVPRQENHFFINSNRNLSRIDWRAHTAHTAQKDHVMRNQYNGP